AWVDPRRGDASFAEVAATWLAQNPAKRASTRTRDEAIVRLYLDPVLGTRRLGSITPADVRALVAGWSRSPRTVKRMYGVLRAIFNYAVNSDLIGRSPCRGIKLPTPQAIDCHVVDGDAPAALAEATGEYRPMVYLGAVLGLRWAECAGLRVGRLDLLRSTLTVAEQLDRDGRTAPPKSAAGRRTLGVPSWLVEMLGEHLARRGLTGADTDALVFVAPDGGPLDYTNWRRRVWQPATKAAGLDGLKFHDLRRASATAMVLDGVDVRTAQARLGHSDPRLTLAVYAQATDEGDQVATDALGARFQPGARHGRAIEAP
ncbi:MAG TPA: tyrosine-type recombinase/integrase, partial [Acidimicrobiia bacterium]